MIVEVAEEEEEHDDPNEYPAKYEKNPIDLVPDSPFPILQGQLHISRSASTNAGERLPY